VKRFLTTLTLAATPLLAVATPAAAAPPQHTTFSDCYAVDETGGTYCYTTDTVTKITNTPSGNQIEHTSGTNTYRLIWGEGSPYPNYNGVDTLDYKFVFKKGVAHVERFQQTRTLYIEDLTCTNVFTYKSTNGKVQVDDFQGSCTY
jgi:hypothetical protein